jgi:hypothetical protein
MLSIDNLKPPLPRLGSPNARVQPAINGTGSEIG